MYDKGKYLEFLFQGKTSIDKKNVNKFFKCIMLK